MKQTVYGLALAVLAMLVLAITLAVSGKHVRENEMETSLNTAIEQALEQLQNEEENGPESPQELVARFNQLLLLQVESDSELQVEILSADARRGVLDVRITETYRNIMGNEKKAVCRKSVILEEYSEKRAYHTVTFLSEGEVYDRYSLYEGGTVVLPEAPEKDGKTFRCWVKQGESQAWDPAHAAVEENLILDAVFE